MSADELKRTDFRRLPLFQSSCVTVTTIKQAKGYTAHIVHVVFPEELEHDDLTREQQGRAELHVACTRATLMLDLWSTGGRLLAEAEKARAAVEADH